MIAFKLFKQRKNGTIGSLFINQRKIISFGEWIEAEECPTKGYAFRPGWHCTEKPEAPHLSMKNRVWAKIYVKDYYYFDRPKHQGGKWIIAKKIKVLEIL